MKKPRMLLVLHGPPLPLDQGYRHAAYNDVLQLSRLRDLHILILADYAYDYHPDQYDLTRGHLSKLPGVRSIDLVSVRPDWVSPQRRRFLHYVRAFAYRRGVLESLGTEKLVDHIIELCGRYQCSEVHFEITHSIFVDTFFRLRELAPMLSLSFTAHDIEADAELLICVRRAWAGRRYLATVGRWMEYRIRLHQELRACRLSRFVVAMAHEDFTRLARAGVNAHFMSPVLHVIQPQSAIRPLPRKPVLALLGSLGYHATGGGTEAFLRDVVPSIHAHVPDAEVRVIGQDASRHAIELCRRLGVRYQEYVDDLEELWKEVTVLASPLLVAKGVRIRVLEAAYRGIPVVCTREAATGFARANEFLRVAGDFKSFAAHCVELLTSSTEYERQEQRIHAYFEANLSKQVIQQKWDRLGRNGSMGRTAPWEELALRPGW